MYIRLITHKTLSECIEWLNHKKNPIEEFHYSIYTVLCFSTITPFSRFIIYLMPAISLYNVVFTAPYQCKSGICWLYLFYVPISLFRMSLLGQRRREPSACRCRWPPLFLVWLYVDRSCLREESVRRVSESAQALQIVTCHKTPGGGGGVRNLHWDALPF